MHYELKELVEERLWNVIDSLRCHINGQADVELHSQRAKTRKKAIAIALEGYDDYAKTGILQTTDADILDSAHQQYPTEYAEVRDSVLDKIDDPETRKGIEKILTMNQL
jgi:hypothetical protein